MNKGRILDELARAALRETDVVALYGVCCDLEANGGADLGETRAAMSLIALEEGLLQMEGADSLEAAIARVSTRLTGSENLEKARARLLDLRRIERESVGGVHMAAMQGHKE